ncbi:MAG: hypothetical protein ACR2PL_05575, partial [Dehalococcoidia bacterium]
MRIHRLVNGIAVARFVLALLVLMLLATAVDSVLTMEHTLQPLNNELTRDAYHLETSWLDLPMIGLTELGTDPPLFVFAALVAIWAYRRGQQRDGFI